MTNCSLDISKLLKDCENVSLEMDDRIELVPYYKLNIHNKDEVEKVLEKSNELEFFNIFFNVKDISTYAGDISAIVSVNENKIIGFYRSVKAENKGYYRPGYTFINEEHRSKGYYREAMTKYFEDKKGITFIIDGNTRKERFFSSLGFKKMKDKGVNCDDIEVGTFWVKISKQ